MKRSILACGILAACAAFAVEPEVKAFEAAMKAANPNARLNVR